MNIKKYQKIVVLMRGQIAGGKAKNPPKDLVKGWFGWRVEGHILPIIKKEIVEEMQRLKLVTIEGHRARYVTRTGGPWDDDTTAVLCPMCGHDWAAHAARHCRHCGTECLFETLVYHGVIVPLAKAKAKRWLGMK